MPAFGKQVDKQLDLVAGGGVHLADIGNRICAQKRQGDYDIVSALAPRFLNSNKVDREAQAAIIYTAAITHLCPWRADELGKALATSN